LPSSAVLHREMQMTFPNIARYLLLVAHMRTRI
jgi:hypothetical protein